MTVRPKENAGERVCGFALTEWKGLGKRNLYPEMNYRREGRSGALSADAAIRGDDIASDRQR